MCLVVVRQLTANKRDVPPEGVELIREGRRHLHLVDPFFDLIEAGKELGLVFRDRGTKQFFFEREQGAVPVVDA